jgi:hypothetical protein
MIANIPGRGFGPSASIPFVVTRGYSIGAVVIVTAQVVLTALLRDDSALAVNLRDNSALAVNLEGDAD